MEEERQNQRKTENLEEIITGEFETVKNSYYRPPLKGPKMITEVHEGVSGIGTAFLDYINSTVGINLNFVEKLALGSAGNSSASPDFRTIARGLISHEIGHYAFHPSELSLSLFLSYSVANFFPDIEETIQKIIYGLYIDHQDNNLVVNNEMHSQDLRNVLTADFEIRNANPCLLDIALQREYRRTLSLPESRLIKDARLSKEEADKIDCTLKELKKISFSSSEDYGFHASQIKIFGDAILPLIESNKCEEENSKGGLYILSSSGANRLITAGGIDSLPEEGKNKVMLSLEKISKKVSKKAYEKILKHFIKVTDEADSSGKGIGTAMLETRFAERAVIEYYKTLARVHNGIIIRPRRLSALKPQKIEFGVREFQTTDNPSRLDLRFSGGKIIPTLSKTHRQREVLSPSELDIVPSLILYKDASGSMADPASEKCYATLAGTMLVQSYLGSGAEVSVALFDTSCDVLLKSRKEDELLGILCGYKGGGTTFDIEKMLKELKETVSAHGMEERMLASHPLARKYMRKNARISLDRNKKNKGLVDLVIITDGGISNIKDIISLLKENAKCRPAILHSGEFRLEVNGYDQMTSGKYEGITIYRTNSADDFVKFGKKILYDNLLEDNRKRSPILS